MLSFEVEERVFEFNFPAGTSRGTLPTKKSWFITVSSGELIQKGIGECSVIEGLTPEFVSEFQYLQLINQAIKFLELENLQNVVFQFENKFVFLCLS